MNDLHNKFFCQITAVLLALAACSFSNIPASFAANNLYQLDSLAGEYDWILYGDVDTIFNKTQEMAGCKQFDSVFVSYQQTGSSYLLRGLEAPVFRPTKYEEFWYQNGKASGLKRLKECPLPAQEQGAICFRMHGRDNKNFYATTVANCAMRLLLEAKLKQSNVAAVLVPDGEFDNVGQSLRQFNFLALSDGAPQGMSKTSFKLISYPAATEKIFYYAPTGSF